MALLSLLCLLLLVACGPGSSQPVHTDNTDDMKLKVALTSLSSATLPDMVALDKGYFKAQGLTVYPIPFTVESSSPQMAEAIHSGAVEVAIGGLLTDAFLVSQIDSDVKVIGQLQTSFPNDITVSNKFLQQTGLSESSPLEAKVKALVGKKIGVVSTTGQTGGLVSYLFHLFGLNASKDAILVPVGNNVLSAVAALKAGRVDALSFYKPVGEAVQTQGLGRIFISPLRGDVPQMQGQLNSVFYAKASLIRAKPNTIKALVRAITMALAFIQKYPDQAIKILQKYTHIDDKTAAAAAQDLRFSYATTPIVNEQGYNVTASFALQTGAVKKIPPFSTLVDTQTAAQALQGFTPQV
ncbi:ABC transporter substrate-binding protein [Thermogemmatispora sp.]|uniref:ABC transporter substrate-binding protein n=1 Tax=Thermogemmatispora sp. TaxID=1968838 RepID=UPI001DE6EB3F|nr:ABC transporter substrate-binding protein [Thermogemmatispora sp.]MBX5450199.1 ABC transporter substrate-binding protein [Thermogemmatispora sp.]